MIDELLTRTEESFQLTRERDEARQRAIRNGNRARSSWEDARLQERAAQERLYAGLLGRLRNAVGR